MTQEEYSKLIEQVSMECVLEVGKVRVQVEQKLPPEVRPNFVTNVAIAFLAAAIELMVEEMKGETELPDDFGDRLYELKKKIGDAIAPIVAELAGPGFISVRKRVEVDPKNAKEDL